MMSDTETVDTTETSWGYAISTDPVPLADAADAVARVINGYIDTANPADEVVDHLETAQKAVDLIIDIGDIGDENSKVVIRIGGRATPRHANVPGPDEMLTISVSVIDIPDAPEVSGDITAPVAVDGGSFSQIK